MKKLFTLSALVFLGWTAKANNIQVSNTSLSGQNVATHSSQVNFDISWENSWRTSSNESNYDGAWVIVKFRKANTSVWMHATLNYVAPGTAAASGHTQPTGSVLEGSADGKGVFLYRNANGTGNVNYTGASLKWNYGADGVLDNDSVEVRVFAVEMVYVTSGAFYLGTGGTEDYCFKTGGSSSPYLVTSDSAIIIGSSAGNLSYGTGGGDMLGPLPSNFPKGFNAFWCMKHEFSEQLYADFLNTLDATRAANRNVGIPGTVNNFVPDYPERAAGNLSAVDFLALLDWMALRPMTELEFEKACRGFNISPIPNEYAWGSTTLSLTSATNNPGTASETPVSGMAAYYISVWTPGLGRAGRCGMWARDTSVSREESSATYYGILEMSGNTAEYVVAVGNVSGRAFTGQHGDGALDGNGASNVTNWNSAGIGSRGGSFYLYEPSLRTSSRTNANTFNGSTRSASFGGRGVRTAQ